MINWATASELDRADQQRSSPEWVAQQWRSERASVVVIDERGRFATKPGGDRLDLARPSAEYDSQRHHLLGLLAGLPIFAAQSTHSTKSAEVHDFREVAASLTDSERDIVATAAALTQWHLREPRCPACGEATQVIKGGFARHCLTCSHDHFPRTDPAVIVAVLDADDRLLLGSQASWPARRVSILAGFVETGESLEQCIHREIAEEVGVQLAAVRYYGSQPWPFPRSLMLGFAARASSLDICVDGDEIEFADWFTRQQVRDQVASGALGLPGASSIAYRMIYSWLDGDLPV
ncbi:MAG TPA: NAD(+) diphosphatase [Propionibacteriaceae bacterium]|nr:NAD(+) diphosphatase [Propionibacteriaceae bacterium]